MFDDNKGIAVGKITKLYGSNGEMIMRLYNEFPEEPDFDEPFYVQLGGITTPVFIGNFTKQGQNKAVVTFDDFDNEYRARELVGTELCSFGLDGEDDFNFEDIIGFAINDRRSGKSGIITGYIDSNKNPLFEVDMNGVELYVPAVENIVEMIDMDNEYVDVNLPAGLLDLYEQGDNYED